MHLQNGHVLCFSHMPFTPSAARRKTGLAELIGELIRIERTVGGDESERQSKTLHRSTRFHRRFFRVRDFLDIHKPDYLALQNRFGRGGNTSFALPLDESSLSRIGVWEDEISGTPATYEDKLQPTFLDGTSFLKKEMVEYAMDYLSRVEEDGTRSLRAIINDDDTEMQRSYARGFSTHPKTRHQSGRRFFSDITLPRGFDG